MTTDTIAGKYKIIREIARSNDVVYEAVDTEMGRRIALKELVIPPNLTGQARRERIERFNQIFREYFPAEPPARAVCQPLKLYPGALVMFTAVACVGSA